VCFLAYSNLNEYKSASLSLILSLTGLPARLLTSVPCFQCTAREMVSPKSSLQSDSVKPSMGLPSGVCSSTKMPPAAEVEKLSLSSLPVKVMGFVVISAPLSGALTETKPSMRIV